MKELRYLLNQATYQMQKDYTLKRLMDKENERLHKQLFNKTNKPSKKQGSGFAQHMTSEENLDALAREAWAAAWAAAMKEIFKDAVFKQQKDKYEKYCKEVAAEERARQKEAAKVVKDAERFQEQQRKDIEKFRAQEQRKRERAWQKAIRDEAKLHKAAEAAAAKAEKAALAASRQNAGRLRKQTKDAIVHEVDEE